VARRHDREELELVIGRIRALHHPFNIGGVFPAQPADDLTCTNLPAGVEPCD
jgi:hypothetical protein